MEYENLYIHIDFRKKQSLLRPLQQEKIYQASLRHQRRFDHPIKSGEFPFPRQEWDALCKYLSNADLITTRDSSDTRDASNRDQIAKDMGRALFNALFNTNPTVYDFYQDCIKQQKAKGIGLRLRILSDDDELAQLPWEMMYDPDYKSDPKRGEFLCLSNDPRISIVRVPPTTNRWNGEAVRGTVPLRVLGMVAQPTTLKHLEYAYSEERNITGALNPLRDVVTLEWKTPKIDTLNQMAKESCHIFHFIGHGKYDASAQEGRGEGYISLEDEHKAEHQLPASRLRSLLSSCKDLRLVVLNSCEGARGNRMSSVASCIAAEGIPAVLAMQYKIRDSMANFFAGKFYRTLVPQGNLDDALFEARLYIKRKGATVFDWTMPALYMHAENGVAFDLTERLQDVPTQPIPTQLIPTPTLPTPTLPPPLWLRVILLLIIVMTPIIMYIGLPVPSSPGYNCWIQLLPPFSRSDDLDVLVQSKVWHAPWTQCSDLLGLSSGSFVFDHWSAANDDMQNATQAYHSQHSADMDTSLNRAISDDPQNAEAQIYKENEQVLASGQDYIIAILGASFQSGNLGGMRDILQGAYIAQKLYNQQAHTNRHQQMIILIANAGSDANDAPAVAQGIVDFTKQHKNVIGVMGWPRSSDTLNVRDILTRNNIVMVSPTASSKDLTWNPFFFRVVPSDISQATVAAQYISHDPHSKHVAILYDKSTPYTIGLGNEVKRQLDRLSSSINADQIGYNDGSQTLDSALNEILQARNKYNLVYLASYVNDAQIVLTKMMQSAPADLKVMGGDGLAVLKNYPDGQQGLDHLVITTFASQDEWNFEGRSSDTTWTDFQNTYRDTFSPNKQPLIDSDVMLAYDAMNVLLQGYQQVPNKSGCLTCQIAKALATLKGYQGVSGQISFNASSSDPIHKVVVIAHVANGRLYTDDIQTPDQGQGCFFASSCPVN